LNTSSGIIDNRQSELVTEFREMCRGSDRVRIASGYFYVNGFELVKDALIQIRDIRIIMGDETDEVTANEIKTGYEARIRRRILNDFDNMDESDDSKIQMMRTLSDYIENGRIKVRIYDKNKFHAKAYLFDSEESRHARAAIIGSSNFSYMGMTKNGNVELNSIHKNDAELNVLNDWYEDIWNESDEFNSDMLKIIQSTIPYIHKITHDECYVTPMELFKIMAYEFLDGDIDIQDSILTEFQRIGVTNARRKLDDFNGCIIADSVGLGKTFIGMELIKGAQADGRNVLLITPKNVKNNWESEMKRKDANGRRRFEIDTSEERLKIVTITELSRYDLTKTTDRGDLDMMKRKYDFVVIDEAHRFRNKGSFVDTGDDGQQRSDGRLPGEYSGIKNYANLNYMRAEGKQFVLLTATPLNNSVLDLYHLLKLFLNSTTLQNKNSDLRLDDFVDYHKCTAKIKDEKAKEQPDSDLIEKKEKERDVHLNGIIKILEEVMILRTRTDISSRYPDLRINQKPVSFVLPQINPERYGLDPKYADIYEGVNTLIQEMHVPHISMINENSGSVLTGLYKILLFKRFESSIHSFVESLNSLRDKEITMRDEINREGWEKIRNRRRSDPDYDSDVIENDFELAELISDNSPDQHPDDSTESDILDMIKFDLERIDGFMKQYIDKMKKQDHVYDDQKLDCLVAILKKRHGEKVLIFTQYVDTARYLYLNLRQYADYTGQNLDCVTGSNEEDPIGTSTDTYDKIGRFSPIANSYEIRDGDREIDIMISTDSLSEGVNLQDCSIIINYDLPWNPMRIVQRVGRIDRIGNLDKTTVFNILPDKRLDVFLDLVDKLNTKISNISQIIGKDNYILTNDEDNNPRTIGEKIRTMTDTHNFADYERIGRNEMLDSVNGSEQDAIKTLEVKSLIRYLGINKSDFKKYPHPMYSIIRSDKIKGVFVMFRIYDEKRGDKINNVVVHWDQKVDAFRIIQIDEPGLHLSDDRILEGDAWKNGNGASQIRNRIIDHFEREYYQKAKEQFSGVRMIPDSTNLIQTAITVRLKKICENESLLSSQPETELKKKAEELLCVFTGYAISDVGIDHLKKKYFGHLGNGQPRSSAVIQAMNGYEVGKFVQVLGSFYENYIKSNPDYTSRRDENDIVYDIICWGASI